MTVLGAGMALAQAPAAAPAAVSAPPTKVAVIQIQAALAATKEGQKAAADLEVKLSPRKKELDGKQAEIKDLQERLQRGGNTQQVAPRKTSPAVSTPRPRVTIVSSKMRRPNWSRSNRKSWACWARR